MSQLMLLNDYVSKGPTTVAKIIEFKKDTDQLVHLNLTAENKDITVSLLSDIDLFTAWVEKEIKAAGARYGVGGYAEHRTIYSRSNHFNSGGEPRIVHLGTDIWAPEGSIIYSPLDAIVHSFNFNNNLGDYGGTIILKHQFGTFEFHTLYGHLSLNSISGLSEGQKISSGQQLAELGGVLENGNWPPHLHFQLILDMEGMKGDYPGVCKLSEKNKYLSNCPDPEIILQFTF